MKRTVFILLSSLFIISCYAQKKSVPGDHYLFREFTPGIVLLKTGKNDPKSLNYNSLAEELVFDNRGQILAVPKEQLARIDTVFINDSKFIVLNNKFVELLHHSTWDLYVEHKCHLKEQGKNAGYGGTSQTSAISNPSAVNLGGMVYEMQLPDGFQIERYFVYWLKRDSEAIQFINLKQLKKIYKDRNEAFNAYLKSKEVKYENQQDMLQFIHHLESK